MTKEDILSEILKGNEVWVIKFNTYMTDTRKQLVLAKDKSGDGTNLHGGNVVASKYFILSDEDKQFIKNNSNFTITAL